MQASLNKFKEKVVSFLKSYRISTPANAIYLIVCVILSCIQLSGNFIFGDHLNDFSAYYYAAKGLFQNPLDIYNLTYFNTYHAYVFRYFPAMLALFFPLTVIDLIPAYIIFSVASFFLNLINIYLTVEILRKFTKNFNQKVIEIFAATMLVLPFWVDFYVQGQISCLLLFVLLLSLRFYLNGREVWGSLLLGLSLMLKPMTFFQIIFVLITCLLAQDIKSLIKRAFFILIPLIPDALLFLSIKGLLQGFLFVNFTLTSLAHFSVSFSSFLVYVLGLPSFPVFVACTLLTIVVGIIVLRKIRNAQERILFSFIFGTFGYFLTWIDLWTNQFPIVFPFLILAAGFLPKYLDQKRFFILYLIYPAAAQMYSIFFAFTDPALGNLAITPFIPIVAFSLILMVGYYVYITYRGKSDILLINITDLPLNEK